MGTNCEAVQGTTIQARKSLGPRVPRALLRLRGDEDLVAHARQGDERAFEVLYERHLPGLLAFSRHMLGRPEEAEDATQQVFAAAHRELMEGERPLHLRAWLYTVARNRCLSLLRARREHPVEEVRVFTAGLQNEVAQRADLQELLGDLYDLPDDQRAALVLSELDDLSHIEIADVLGCEVQNVKGLVFRARAGLMERREAREAPCSEIRVELAAARRGGLRRGRLRHHLKSCPGCAAYLEDLRSQRSMLALVLPVAPSAGLKPAILGSIGLGGGAAAGGLAALGTAGTAATIAATAVVAGATIAGQGPLGDDRAKREVPAPAAGVAAPAKTPASAATRRVPRTAANRSASGFPRRRAGGRAVTPKRRARPSRSGRDRANGIALGAGRRKRQSVKVKRAKPERPAGGRGRSGSAPRAPSACRRPRTSSRCAEGKRSRYPLASRAEASTRAPIRQGWSPQAEAAVTPDSRPVLAELAVAGEPAAWREIGFDVGPEDVVPIGMASIRLVGADAGRRIVRWWLHDLGSTELDGLPTERAQRPPTAVQAQTHPNGALRLDHVVAFTPDLDRSVASIRQAGLDFRRLREGPTPAGAQRQAFFRVGEVILEVVEHPPGTPAAADSDAPARFYGLALVTEDIDATAATLGPLLGEVRDAVQPGRRIATVRREAGLGLPVAFMSR